MKEKLIRIDLEVNTFDLLNNGIDPLKTHDVFQILLKSVNKGELVNDKNKLINKIKELNKNYKFGDRDLSYKKPNFS